MFRSQFALSLSLYKIGCTSDIEARLHPDLHITLNISNYMNINIKDCKEEFIELLRSTEREGVEDVIEGLEEM